MAQQLSGWATPPEVGEKRKQLPTVKTFPGEGAEEAEEAEEGEERRDEEEGGTAVVGTWKEEEQRGGVPPFFL